MHTLKHLCKMNSDAITQDSRAGKDRTGSDRSLNSSTDFTHYGLTGITRTSANTSAWGRTKTLGGLYQKEWLFLVISTINILATIVLTTIQLVKAPDNSPDFTLTILILINSVFCAYYVYHGVLKEREFEIYVFIAAVFVILVYCIGEYSGNVPGRSVIKLVRLIAACALGPPNIYLAWSVARDFGYLAFKVVGASHLLQVMYRQSAMFASLLHFDLQISLSFIVLALRNGVKLNAANNWTLAVGVPFSLVWFLIGLGMLYSELKPLIVVFVILGLAKPSYILYRIIETSLLLPGIPLAKRTLEYAMFIAGAINLLLFVLLMCGLFFVVRNFGEGLRDRVYRPDRGESSGLLGGERSSRSTE